MTGGYFLAPSGQRITGSCDVVLATAHVVGFLKNDDGTFEPEYGGGSDVHWDSQETRKNDAGEFLYQDDDGTEWTLSQCTFIEEGTE